MLYSNHVAKNERKLNYFFIFPVQASPIKAIDKKQKWKLPLLQQFCNLDSHFFPPVKVDKNCLFLNTANIGSAAMMVTVHSIVWKQIICSILNMRRKFVRDWRNQIYWLFCFTPIKPLGKRVFRIESID